MTSAQPLPRALRLALKIPLGILAVAFLLAMLPLPTALKPNLGWLFTLPLLAEAIAVPIAIIYLTRAPYARSTDKALTIVAAIPLAMALLFYVAARAGRFHV